MTYWLVNSGTTEDPYHPPRDKIAARFEEWEAEWGPVHFFDRAYGMQRGDVLIHRAIGSDRARLIAVGEVLSRPRSSGHERWPFMVERRMIHIAANLLDAPTLADIGELPVRVTKRLAHSVGQQAQRLIADAARGT